MDDWVVIAPTRWRLRSAIRIVNKTLNVLKVEQHPNKTFIGKAERDFDFLGYYLKPGVLMVSRGTFVRFTVRISQLYEQGADYLHIGEGLPVHPLSNLTHYCSLSARPGYCSIRGLLSRLICVCSLIAFLTYFGMLKRAW